SLDIFSQISLIFVYKDPIFESYEMSTSKTYQQSLADAEDLQGDALLHYDAEIEVMNLILLSIPNDIYNSVDACTSAKDMWKRVKRLMRGTIQNKVNRETHFTNEFDQFVAEPGEALVSVYNRFAQLMNNLERNDMHFSIQFEKLVNTSSAKKLEKSHDSLALVAHTGSSSKNTSSYYVTHPTSVVDYDDEYQQEDIQNNYEDPLTSAIGKGHYARNCPKPRVRDSKYFMEQMLLAKHDEAGVILTDEQNDFLYADASRMEEIEDLSANICLMARIQPTNHTSDAGPSYDSVFVGKVQSLSINENEEQMYPTHTKIIISIIGDDQIDSNIIIDTHNGNVNSDSVEKDTHVPDLYVLEQLARNAYQEAKKQQIFAQKVQKQNTTLTSKLELYKERVRVLENIKGDNNYLNEFLEADQRAKYFDQQAQSQFIRMNVASSVRRSMNRDSHDKNNVLANSKNSAKKVAVYLRKNKQTDDTSANVVSNKENVIDVDVANASKVKTLLCVSLGEHVLLKVSPWKGVLSFRKKGKLAPRASGNLRTRVQEAKIE
nr:hypothetical protein [Tanacetum cinerariifolium]